MSMLALYRRHSYITHAYGNFLGLARLLYFFAHETGHDVGNLLVVTGHATVDAPGRSTARRGRGGGRFPDGHRNRSPSPRSNVVDLDLRPRTVGAPAS